MEAGDILNRREFERFCSRCREEQETMPGLNAVLLASVDYFERLQMTHTLDEADRITELLEELLLREQKEGMRISKFSEGIYVIAVHGLSDSTELSSLCRHFHEVLRIPDGRNTEVTVSIGAAVCSHDPGRGYKCAYDLAMQALNQVRKSGQSGAMVFSDEPEGSRQKTRVLLVEDQELVRKFLEDSIRSSWNYELTASLRNADLTDVYCERGNVDLILMDVYTQGGASGLSAAERIKAKHPRIRIIIITSMPEVSYLERARKIGVESFWYKEVNDEPLLLLMDRTMAGESVYPDRTPELRLGSMSSYEFTDREIDILRELTSGGTNEEIADRLYLSKNTVKDYITKLLLKTGFRSRTELAVKARESGMVVRDQK